LKGLDLADVNLIESDETGHDHNDILIGCDYHFVMVNNEMVRGERSGCAAVGSKFG
jgi:hypothetical protein